MRKKSHWRLADYLLRKNDRPMIELMFKIGSVAPDFMIRSMAQGHAYTTTAHRVEKRLEKLEENGCWNLVSAYRLGYITHYLADYFTAPHNECFDYSLKEHCVFEKRQMHYLRQQLIGQWNRPKAYEEQGDLMQYLRELHEEYIVQQPTVESDCQYIVNITEQVSYQMFALFNERQPEYRIRFFRHRAVM